MYGGKGIVIHIGVNDNNVITAYKARKHLGANLIKEAFATLKENVQAALKSNENLREELNEEIEYFRAEYKRTRSAPKRMAYQARINALQMRLDELPTESLDLKRDLYKVCGRSGGICLTQYGSFLLSRLSARSLSAAWRGKRTKTKPKRTRSKGARPSENVGVAVK